MQMCNSFPRRTIQEFRLAEKENCSRWRPLSPPALLPPTPPVPPAPRRRLLRARRPPSSTTIHQRRGTAPPRPPAPSIPLSPLGAVPRPSDGGTSHHPLTTVPAPRIRTSCSPVEPSLRPFRTCSGWLLRWLLCRLPWVGYLSSVLGDISLGRRLASLTRPVG